MKAIKNNAEMEGMKRAHLSDGVAMAHAISWLENAIVNEGRSVSEVEIDEVVTGERAKQPGYVENSFPTIAGVGSNGAIIHYRAQADSDLLQYLDTSNPILIDSGGQYTYGTTDVTRTWHFGEATADFKENFTRVLKGHIGVDTMIFPTNTPGFVLDVFARKSLWEVGLDYGHGTGHGVGAALNVHEGPFGIAPRFGNQEVMKKGMVVSNEPGVYEDGSYGIRIENLLECTYVLDEDNEAFDAGLIDGDEGFPEKSPGKKTFLRFNKLTMIPIQKNLIDTNLMTTEELEWIDNYHQEVFDKVSPLLEKDTPAYKWLTTCTSSMNTKE
jgi:Xaa-Pro aminopeptidase